MADWIIVAECPFCEKSWRELHESDTYHKIEPRLREHISEDHTWEDTQLIAVEEDNE